MVIDQVQAQPTLPSGMDQLTVTVTHERIGQSPGRWMNIRMIFKTVITVE